MLVRAANALSGLKEHDDEEAELFREFRATPAARLRRVRTGITMRGVACSLITVKGKAACNLHYG